MEITGGAYDEFEKDYITEEPNEQPPVKTPPVSRGRSIDELKQYRQVNAAEERSKVAAAAPLNPEGYGQGFNKAIESGREEGALFSGEPQVPELSPMIPETPEYEKPPAMVEFGGGDSITGTPKEVLAGIDAQNKTDRNKKLQDQKDKETVNVHRIAEFKRLQDLNDAKREEEIKFYKNIGRDSIADKAKLRAKSDNPHILGKDLKAVGTVALAFNNQLDDNGNPVTVSAEDYESFLKSAPRKGNITSSTRQADFDNEIIRQTVKDEVNRGVAAIDAKIKDNPNMTMDEFTELRNSLFSPLSSGVGNAIASRLIPESMKTEDNMWHLNEPFYRPWYNKMKEANPDLKDNEASRNLFTENRVNGSFYLDGNGKVNQVRLTPQEIAAKLRKERVQGIVKAISSPGEGGVKIDIRKPVHKDALIASGAPEATVNAIASVSDDIEFKEDSYEEIDMLQTKGTVNVASIASKLIKALEGNPDQDVEALIRSELMKDENGIIKGSIGARMAVYGKEVLEAARSQGRQSIDEHLANVRKGVVESTAALTTKLGQHDSNGVFSSYASKVDDGDWRLAVGDAVQKEKISQKANEYILGMLGIGPDSAEYDSVVDMLEKPMDELSKEWPELYDTKRVVLAGMQKGAFENSKVKREEAKAANKEREVEYKRASDAAGSLQVLAAMIAHGMEFVVEEKEVIFFTDKEYKQLYLTAKKKGFSNNERDAILSLIGMNDKLPDIGIAPGRIIYGDPVQRQDSSRPFSIGNYINRTKYNIAKGIADGNGELMTGSMSVEGRKLMDEHWSSYIHDDGTIKKTIMDNEKGINLPDSLKDFASKPHVARLLGLAREAKANNRRMYLNAAYAMANNHAFMDALNKTAGNIHEITNPLFSILLSDAIGYTREDIRSWGVENYSNPEYLTEKIMEKFDEAKDDPWKEKRLFNAYMYGGMKDMLGLFDEGVNKKDGIFPNLRKINDLEMQKYIPAEYRPTFKSWKLKEFKKRVEKKLGPIAIKAGREKAGGQYV